MENKLLNEGTPSGEMPYNSTFCADFNRYFEVVSKEQLLDRSLWRLLER